MENDDAIKATLNQTIDNIISGANPDAKVVGPAVDSAQVKTDDKNPATTKNPFATPTAPKPADTSVDNTASTTNNAAPVAEPSLAVPSGASDLEKIKVEALNDLMPLLEKLDLTPEKKFDIYKDAVELAKDKGYVEKALEAAKAIKDEKKKAEGLLFVVEAVDGFSGK